MATDLATIYGTEFSLLPQPQTHERSQASYPGGDGLTSLYSGKRGLPMVVTGRLWYTNSTYNTARAALEAMIDEINAYQSEEPADYTYRGTTYYNVVFGPLRLIPAGNRRLYSWDGSTLGVAFTQELLCL